MRGRGPTYLATNALATRKYLEGSTQEAINFRHSSQSKRRRLDSEHTDVVLELDPQSGSGDSQSSLPLTINLLMPGAQCLTPAIYLHWTSRMRSP